MMNERSEIADYRNRLWPLRLNGAGGVLGRVRGEAGGHSIIRRPSIALGNGACRFPSAVENEAGHSPVPFSLLLVLAAAGICMGSSGRLYSPGNERAYAEYAAGIYAEISREDKLALLHFRRAASGLPESAGVAARLGSLCLKFNSPQEAQRYLVRASGLAPEDTALKVYAAQACALAGLPQEGTRYLEEVLQKEPGWAGGYCRVAEIYKRLGMWASAADAYARLAQIRGMRDMAYEKLGDLYLDMGREHARSRRLYGQVLSFRRALRWFDEIESFGPGLESVMLGRAKCYFGISQFDEAVRECQKYLTVNSKDIAARRFLAQIHWQRGDLEKAAKTYKELVRKNPMFFRAHVEFVELLLEAGDLQRAAAAAEDFAARFPKKSVSNCLAGKCLLRSGDLADAVAYLEKVVELESSPKARETVKEAVFLLGMVHLREGDDEKAMHYFGWTLELDPEDADANNNLGYLTLESGGDLQNALKLIRRAVRIRPRCGEFLDSLGWAYFKMGRMKEALARIKEATTLCREAEVHDHLGQVYQAIGRILEARREWKKALEIDPEYEPARDRLRQSYNNEEQV